MAKQEPVVPEEYCHCDPDLRAQMAKEGNAGKWSWHNARCPVHQIGYLRERLARAEQDVERLDWLEKRGTRLRRAAIGKPWRAIQADGRFTDEEIATDRFATAREAIDAARSKPQETNEA